MRLLVIGASGLVGNTVYEEAKKCNIPVEGTYNTFHTNGLHKLDYSKKNEVVKIIEEQKPEIIICPAGITNVDWIEQNPQKAWKTNIENIRTILETAAAYEIPVAFFSTDYIFDGKNGPYSENDLSNPLNIYGQQKLAAELMLKSYMGEKYFIFRTSYVFGFERQEKNYVYSLTRSLYEGKQTKVANDMFITPTYAPDLAKFVLKIIEKNKYGTYNISGSSYLPRFEFARMIANIFKFNENLVASSKFHEMKIIADRPLKGGLKNDKAINTTGLTFTPLDQSLKETKNLMEKNSQFPPKPVVEEKQTTSLQGGKATDSKICIFIPCFNATVTLPKVLERIPASIKDKVQEIFIVDNNSIDYTYLLAVGYREHSDTKNLKILKNLKNFGYGGSQKLAYSYAIKQGYDMVVMLHGDAQYAPEKLPVMIEAMEKDKSIDLLFGSRMTGDPLKGGMPLHRYLGNIALTFIQNILLGTHISEFHSGYRIFRTRALKEVPFHLCNNDYHFDTEIIILFIKNKFKIREVPIDTYYGDEKCYVNIWKYGLRVLLTTFCFFLDQKRIRKYELYKDGLKADTEKILKELKTEIIS